MAKKALKQKSSSFSLCKLYPSFCRPADKDVVEAKSSLNVCHRSLNYSVMSKELPHGNSSRKIVETIFKSSWFKPQMKNVKVERVVKINHREDILCRFEEYREMTKRKAGKECSRCMADGNEMLRFHGFSIMCSLNVINGVVELCSLKGCNVCKILRTLFYYKRRTSLSVLYTTASSRLAHDCIHIHSHDDAGSTIAVKRRVMLVCRVIAGHLHNQESCWMQVGIYSHCMTEEAYYSNVRAFLPRFLIVYSLRE
ncbi:hypothetical protein SUGI_0457750 [Cryptomeria japonica]|nr:hypothetical protein SUGI_0457750 [Cryptomeria japonica]